MEPLGCIMVNMPDMKLDHCTELYWWTHTSIAGPAGASRIKDTVLGRFGVGVLGPGATGGRYRRIHLLVAGQWIERFES